MTRSVGTEQTKKLAEIYRAAAKRLEDCDACGCCKALSGSPERVYNRFAKVFKPDHASSYWWGDCCCHYGDPRTRGPRVLAFGFMAAMVEAGDA